MWSEMSQYTPRNASSREPSPTVVGIAAQPGRPSSSPTQSPSLVRICVRPLRCRYAITRTAVVIEPANTVAMINCLIGDPPAGRLASLAVASVVARRDMRVELQCPGHCRRDAPSAGYSGVRYIAVTGRAIA
jgi:hypothetical protein